MVGLTPIKVKAENMSPKGMRSMLNSVDHQSVVPHGEIPLIWDTSRCDRDPTS